MSPQTHKPAARGDCPWSSDRGSILFWIYQNKKSWESQDKLQSFTKQRCKSLHEDMLIYLAEFYLATWQISQPLFSRYTGTRCFQTSGSDFSALRYADYVSDWTIRPHSPKPIQRDIFRPNITCRSLPRIKKLYWTKSNYRRVLLDEITNWWIVPLDCSVNSPTKCPAKIICAKCWSVDESSLVFCAPASHIR